MDALSEELRSHNQQIEALREVILLKQKYRKLLGEEIDIANECIDQLQSEASIMSQEIRSGKNLS